MNKTLTRGNIIIEDIQIGDIHYEFERGMGIKCQVVTLPIRNEQGLWAWESKNLTTGKTINYRVNEKYPHYGPNLYDYEAYVVSRWI